MKLKRILYIIIYICCLTDTQAAESGSKNKELLNSLDQTIKNRKQYHAEKEKLINNIKTQLQQSSSAEERFNLYSQLYETYITYQVDSALECACEKGKLLSNLKGNEFLYDAQFNFVGFMTITGMYKEALDVLNHIPRSSLPQNLVQAYFHHFRTLYGHMADYTLTDEEKNKYLQYVDNYRDSLLSVISPDEIDFLIIKADQLNAHRQYDEAIKILKTVTDTCKNIRELRFLAYTISESYRQKGEKENQKHYLAISAIADLQSSVKEYISLRKLALLLYEEGDIDRAYEYMKCSLEDALSCNARSRTIEVAEIFPVIDKAYQLKSERKQHIIYILLFSISILVLCLIAAIIYVYKQMKKLAAAHHALADANNQLQDINKVLSETNTIKEEYIAQYINRCSVYIDKIDKYRRQLAKLATTSKIEELFKTIKSEEFIEHERKEFYNEFDHTFLGLFPDFVIAFNALLNEKDRIFPKPGELLNTELRIFALIRLGITDSTRIAEFLQYSVTTIYNYRSKIRNKAIGDKNEFESLVMKIS